MNYPTIVDGIDFKELVFITNNDPVTDSFMVAKAFRKRHDNVVRDVERTIAACPEEFDTKLNFEVCYKNNELQNGKPQKFYRLRKDGLMLLVMSYTKKEAMRIKIAYINAFNWMAEQLSRRMAMGEEMQHRYAIKETRSKLKGTIGSRLMNERKKEKRVLAVEHEHIMQVTQPDLLIG